VRLAIAPRSRPYSEIVPPSSAPVEIGGGERRLDSSPFDVKREYKNLMSMIEEEKEKEQFWSKMPYKLGYIVIGVVVFGLLCRSIYGTYADVQEKQKSVEAESDLCLIKYASLKCELSNPTDQCQKVLTCIKCKEDSAGVFFFITATLSKCKIR